MQSRVGEAPVVVTPPVRFLALLELADVWERPGVEKVYEWKQFMQPILDRSTGEDEHLGLGSGMRAVQLLLGHRKIESTVRYLGIEVDDALAIAEQVDL